MPQSLPHPQPEAVQAPSFEAAPWIARERVVEEPLRAPEPALRLANEEHVIDQRLDGDAIRPVR